MNYVIIILSMQLNKQLKNYTYVCNKQLKVKSCVEHSIYINEIIAAYISKYLLILIKTS